MKWRTTTWAGLTLAIGIATYGCASTKVTSIVSPDAPRYGPGQIMIVASYADIGWRTRIEERFETEHVAFVPSIRLLGVGSMNDPEVIIDSLYAIESVDAVLVVGPEGSGIDESFMVSEYYTGTLSKPWASTSAVLFDKHLEEVIWRADASTKGNAYASWDDIRNSFVGTVVNQLNKDGLLSEETPPPRARTVAAATELANKPSPPQWRRSIPDATEVIVIGVTDLNHAPPSRPMLDRLTAGIVRIQGSRGLGTAFIITRDGLALTNHHVVARQRNLVARFQDNSVASVRVVRSDENADVALIQIDCVQDCVTVPLGSESQITTGSDVYALGHPSGLTASVSRGIVSGLRLMSGVTLLQTDAALNSGNSGGPIVDVASGQVVAIVSFKLTETEGLGFAIVIDDALRVLGVRVSSGQKE